MATIAATTTSITPSPVASLSLPVQTPPEHPTADLYAEVSPVTGGHGGDGFLGSRGRGAGGGAIFDGVFIDSAVMPLYSEIGVVDLANTLLPPASAIAAPSSPDPAPSADVDVDAPPTFAPASVADSTTHYAEIASRSSLRRISSALYAEINDGCRSDVAGVGAAGVETPTDARRDSDSTSAYAEIAAASLYAEIDSRSEVPAAAARGAGEDDAYAEVTSSPTALYSEIEPRNPMMRSVRESLGHAPGHAHNGECEPAADCPGPRYSLLSARESIVSLRRRGAIPIHAANTSSMSQSFDETSRHSSSLYQEIGEG